MGRQSVQRELTAWFAFDRAAMGTPEGAIEGIYINTAG